MGKLEHFNTKRGDLDLLESSIMDMRKDTVLNGNYHNLCNTLGYAFSVSQIHPHVVSRELKEHTIFYLYFHSVIFALCHECSDICGERLEFFNFLALLTLI
jgi:hypothetical protein